jgi:hypothetical protein
MNKYIKIAVAAVLILLGLYMMIFTRNLGWGIVVFLLAAFPILLFFKNEYILLAFWQLRKQNMEKAAEWLQKSQIIKDSFINLNTDISIIFRINTSSGSSDKVEPLMKKLGIWSEYEARQSNGYFESCSSSYF